MAPSIELDDEGMHPADQHPQFNESALLTCFDSHVRSGGYLRIGNRPNEGHAEATFCWFLPDGSALFSFERSSIVGNRDFCSAGIAIDVVEPGKVLSARFRGDAYHLKTPRLLLAPKNAFSSSPKVQVDLALVLTAVSPIYGAKPFPGLDVGGHYEQHMRASGTLTMAGSATSVQALGNRDHSWGPRVWQATHADRTIWCTFGDNFGIAFSITWRSSIPDVYVVIGEVWRDGSMTKITDVSIQSEFEDPARLFHSAFRAHLYLADGECLELSGRTISIAPLRHRRDEKVTHIGWAMSEIMCNGFTGVGLSEYLDLRQ